MDFQRLHTFRTVATLMNFNRAARALNSSQSAVSARIKTLEEEIGVLLFKRHGKAIELTEAGVKMLGYADKLLAIEEEVLSEVTGNNRAAGSLTIRMPQTIATHYLPAILHDFQPRFPQLRLDITSCSQNLLEHELQIGTVDLAFLFAESIGAKKLTAELLRVETLLVVTHPEHALTNGKNLDFTCLSGQVLLLPKNDCGYRMMFEQTLIDEGIKPTTIIEMNSIEAIKQTLKARIGISLLPKIAVKEDLTTGRLLSLPWKDPLETGLLMIRHPEKWQSVPLTAFMETTRRLLIK